MRTTSADVIQPLQAKQSPRVTFRVFVSFDSVFSTFVDLDFHDLVLFICIISSPSFCIPLGDFDSTLTGLTQTYEKDKKISFLIEFYFFQLKLILLQKKKTNIIKHI